MREGGSRRAGRGCAEIARIDFARDSSLKDKDMASIMCIPCLVLFGQPARNGDMGRVILGAGRAIARGADREKRRFFQGRALRPSVTG
jgi:hypothetical protein